jgi:enoyl-CoA hydratase/carnithine racemase
MEPTHAADAAGLEVRKDGELTRLVLNRPQRGNALCAELVTALSEAVARCREDGTRMLVFEGAGPHFCTGFDLSQLDSETDDTLLARFVRVELLLQAIHEAPFVTLALAHGRAMGAGADLFAACEQRWIVDAAAFAFPGAAFGLVLGTARLAARVGATQAREWIRSGAMISADDALRTGLACRDIEAGDVDAAITQLRAGASRLDPATQAAIHEASLHGSAQQAAADLQRLVLSAARPGLRERIARYRAAAKR